MGNGSNGLSGHQRPYRGETDIWLTPPEILKALGGFDLDPCAAVDQPWSTATTQYTIEDDGLAQEWEGFTWCNPPFGAEAKLWLARMAQHRNGIALVAARTETTSFFANIWRAADAVLFLEGRPHFHYPDGTRGRANSGAPICLVGYGREAFDRLASCELDGFFVDVAACAAIRRTIAAGRVAVPAAIPEEEAARLVSGISAMISASYPPGLDAEAHMWRRHQKVTNEAGEVLDAIEGAIGENPRKGVTKTWADVDKELLDTATAALGAYEYNHGNDETSIDALFTHVLSVHDRLASVVTQTEPDRCRHDKVGGCGLDGVNESVAAPCDLLCAPQASIDRTRVVSAPMHEQLHSAVNLAWPCRYGDAECPLLIRQAAEQDGQR